MKAVKSAQRERFEKEALPHVEALWRTALWLTLRSGSAENLVLRTITKAYREHDDSDSAVGIKARLFRVLTKEFSVYGDDIFHSDRILSRDSGSSNDNGNSYRIDKGVSIRGDELPSLANVSMISVKGSIARLQPFSRLVMIMLIRERFSYADIAYITDLKKASVKELLSRLRILIPRSLILQADSIESLSTGRSPLQVAGIRPDKEQRQDQKNRSGPVIEMGIADSAANNWENEGGALKSISRG